VNEIAFIIVALMHFNFDSSTLSLDNVYKALNHDMETYYFLWVAVRKVLAEAPNVMLDLFQSSSCLLEKRQQTDLL
jgi:hypothetical protein